MARDDTQKKDIADRRARFVKLAESRTAGAIKAIRVISKLGNRSHYDYSEADVRKIAAALNKEIEVMKSRMLTRSGKDVIEFKL